MEEIARAALSHPVGKAILTILLVVVGYLLRDWTFGYRDNRNGSRRVDLRAEAKARKRQKREQRKKVVEK